MVATEWLHLSWVVQGDKSARGEAEGHTGKGLGLRGALPLSGLVGLGARIKGRLGRKAQGGNRSRQ